MCYTCVCVFAPGLGGLTPRAASRMVWLQISIESIQVDHTSAKRVNLHTHTQCEAAQNFSATTIVRIGAC